MKIDPNMELDGRTMAQILGLSARRLQQMASDGVVPKNGTNRYPLRDVVRAYGEVLQGKVALSGGLDVVQQRARKESAQASKTEFELSVAKREYVHISIYERQLERFASAAASRFDAIGARLKQRYPSLTGEQIDGIKKEIAEARNAVADLRSPNF